MGAQGRGYCTGGAGLTRTIPVSAELLQLFGGYLHEESPGQGQRPTGWRVPGRRYDGQALAGLWAQVPESMRLTRLAAATVPAQYAGGVLPRGNLASGVDGPESV